MAAIALTAEKFAAAAEKLPTTPQIFSRLSAAMKNPDISVEEIVSVVQMDAALSARVLRLSNSAQYGRGGSINNLADAINRTGFQEDVNVVFPIERLREAGASGSIGSVAAFHYSFMGAASIRAMEAKATELAGLLRRDQVDAVLLSPV